MTQITAPLVGDWYRYIDGRIFEVVAVDEEEGTIETQYYDGTVEEVDVESWEELAPESVEPPEDWAGSMDLQKEDYGVDYDDSPHRAWADPLDYFDSGES